MKTCNTSVKTRAVTVSSLSTREYCGGHVYMDGRLVRTLQPWGYTDADGADYFYITDYLGNVRTVTDKHGYACELNAYYPYGALMNTLTGNGTKQPYKYGGKELDRTAGLDLYDSQARFYDSVLGRTTTVDPKSEAYAGTSHYAWCAGNPVRFVDPDGREGIVVSGSPGNHDNKLHFLVNGLDRALAARNRTTTQVTWIIYNDSQKGFNTNDINRYAKQAMDRNINVRIMSDVDNVIDYVNNKNGGNSRKKDKIQAFYYVGHATPGDLDIGYQGTGEDFDPSDLNADAFAKGCHVNVVGGCRTAIDDTLLFIIPVEKSIVKQFSEILDSTSEIYGSDVKVHYNGGIMNDSNLVKYNNGHIVKINGSKKDE